MMTEAFKKFGLTDRTAVVTGGSVGLGYYMARGLVRSGARVVLAARREAVLKEAADRMAAEVPQGRVVLAVPCWPFDLFCQFVNSMPSARRRLDRGELDETE